MGGNQLYFHLDIINLHVCGQESFALLLVIYKLYRVQNSSKTMKEANLKDSEDLELDKA